MTIGSWRYGSLVTGDKPYVAKFPAETTYYHIYEQKRPMYSETVAEFCGSESDARLMAAAPDLLAAAKEAYEYLELMDRRMYGPEWEIHKLLDKAIIKAEGGIG